jgi:hypothetical protein
MPNVENNFKILQRKFVFFINKLEIVQYCKKKEAFTMFF